MIKTLLAKLKTEVDPNIAKYIEAKIGNQRKVWQENCKASVLTLLTADIGKTLNTHIQPDNNIIHKGLASSNKNKERLL